LWSVEEFGGGGKDMGDGGERNGVVCEVDEACILEAFENRFCSLGTFDWGAVEEEGEVYQL
jgi:hypothetical protein